MSYLLSIVALGTVAQTAPVPSTSEDVLVVADSEFDPQILASDCRMAPKTGIAELKKLGFEEVVDPKTKLAVLFAPKLWQGENIKRQMAFFKALASAIKPDGTVDLSKNADVLGVVQSMFSSYSVDENSAVGTDYQRSFQFTVEGSKPVWVNVTPQIHPSRVKDRPVTQPNNMPGDHFQKFQAIQVRWPRTYQVYGFGKYQPAGAEANWAFRQAVTELTDHIGGYFTARQALYQSLLSHIVSSAKGDWGKNYKDLSADDKASILGEMTGNYGKYGFSSESEASRFLQNATLTSTNTTAYMTIFVAGQGGIAFQLP